MKASILRLLQDENLGGEGDSFTALSLEDIKKHISMKKPIMTRAVETAVLDGITQFSHRDKWNQWGLNDIRKQGSAILLYGPTGTGKTTIAEWMAAQVGKGFKLLSLAEVGGGDPGDTERGVIKFFEDAKKRKNMTICLDDCDNLLFDREGDVEMSWQVGTTETVMRELASYKGLVIACTNLAVKLDPALDRRFLHIVHVERPDHECRLRLWKQKLPAKFPLKLSDVQIDKNLAPFDLSGAQIENVIFNCGSRCIRKKIKPSLQMMADFAERETKKKISREKE